MREKPHERVLLWLNDARGLYIPRDFASSFNDRDATVEGVTREDWLVLEHGPGGMLDKDEHAARYTFLYGHMTDEARGELYWDTWSEVCDDAKVYLDGKEPRANGEPAHFWRIHQDGDCFLVRDDVEHCDECDNWKDKDCGCPHTSDDPDEYAVNDPHSISAHECNGDNR